jgi:hypothetical protein
MLFPSSVSTLQRGGALSEMLSTYKPARCYNPADCIPGAFFLRIVLSNVLHFHSLFFGKGQKVGVDRSVSFRWGNSAETFPSPTFVCFQGDREILQ